MRFYAANLADAALEPAVVSRGVHRPAKLVGIQRKRRLVRRWTMISVFAVAAIIFLFFLRYLTTERAPSGDSGGVRFPVTGTLS